ncbi:SatD family protein [Niabella beijingensis]|uniref:SatD family protein n=1 Tax=Niabella beijingensis TaxID=2872700 RepID=UPI001CBB7D02|nr:SatD family protein [Niabella beijingensis]MBZ4191495.1 SatD family protein [Niabella beijingensis]
MIAIVTGDIIRSETVDPKEWMPLLKNFLKKQGQTPGDWEIYRGDAFQLRLPPAEALFKCMLLKSIIKQKVDLDVRLSIGLGDVSYKTEKLTESNGTAFVRSGRKFDSMKEEKTTLALATGDEKTDTTLNLLARFASLIMDNWSPAAAAIVQLFLEKPEWNQQQVAEKLKINQSAVSQSRKRAQFDLLIDFNKFYQSTITGHTT